MASRARQRTANIGAPVRGSDIAADALRYVGQGYTYGGRGDHPGDWDCSSFVSYVLGRDLGLSLPGGGTYGDPGYPPNVHGPVVMSYATWAGAVTLPDGLAPSAGDLCVFAGLGPLGHIGIALDGTHMVSALNHTDGVQRTGIVGNGPAGARLLYRRITGLRAGTVPAGSQVPGSLSSATAGGLLLLAAPLLAGGVVTVLLTVGALVIAGAGAGAVFAVRRAREA